MNLGAGYRLNVQRPGTGEGKWKRGDDLAERAFGAMEYAQTGGEQSKYTFWHEFGHHVHQQYGVTDEASYMNPPTERKLAKVLYTRDIRKATSATKYGDTNNDELFAENFALYIMGKKDLLSADAITLIEDILQ